MPLLDEIAEIAAGHAFRGAVVREEGAESRVIQMSNVDRQSGVDWAGLDPAVPPGRKEPDWLCPGDVVFLARGRKNFALHLSDLPDGRFVCTQHFFVIRIKDLRFSPAFISWQINQKPIQDYLDMNAAGSNSRNITAGVLKRAEILLASEEHQQAVSKLETLIYREHLLIQSLISTREEQMSALASTLLRK